MRMLGLTYIHYCTQNNQQVYQKGLYSILCNNLYGKESVKE